MTYTFDDAFEDSSKSLWRVLLYNWDDATIRTEYMFDHDNTTKFLVDHAIGLGYEPIGIYRENHYMAFDGHTTEFMAMVLEQAARREMLRVMAEEAHRARIKADGWGLNGD